MSTWTANAVVEQSLRAVPVPDVMAHVAQISTHDRFQASLGIEEAAAYVAEKAAAVGLSDVAVDRFPADGRAHWWTFEAPMAWTPVAAHLTIHARGRRVLEVSQARQPFLVATYSAPLQATERALPLVSVEGSPNDPDFRGALVVVSDLNRENLIPELVAGGALGFIGDASRRSARRDVEHPGRIELPAGTPLTGFSVTSEQLGIARAAAAGGGQARALLEIDTSASMPVVSGVLPGESDEEIWLMAHLCHPRPSANDNASGVAALLGVAAALTSLRGANKSWGAGCTIRFLWGPEFAGIAAALHQMRARAGDFRPAAVLNLDMVGEDQDQCGGPFLVERGPDCTPSLLAPVAEHITAEVFSRTRARPGSWQPALFLGLSDHSVLADPQIGCPVVAFAHAPDRFNHSAGDSIDKVSKAEMHRSTSIATALAKVVSDGMLLPHDELEGIVRRWCRREEAAVRTVAEKERRSGKGDWADKLIDHQARKAAEMLSLASDPPGAPTVSVVEPETTKTLLRCWDGPLNARALLGAMPASSRQAMTRMLRAERSNYALLLESAFRAHGAGSWDDVILDTSLSRREPISEEIAQILVDGLRGSGWLSEV